MMKRAAASLGLLLTLLMMVLKAEASGLSTPFVDIQMPPVALEVPTPVLDVQGHGLRLRNLGDSPIRVRITPVTPAPEQLRGGAAPIPDLGWLTISSSEMLIPAHGEVETVVRLTIPKRRANKGKLFQVMVWSRSIPVEDGGVSFNAGVLSRIRFRTGK